MPHKDAKVRQEYQKRYRGANRERLLKLQQDWYKANKKVAYKKAKKWRGNNEEKIKKYRVKTQSKRRRRNTDWADWHIELTDLVVTEAADLAKMREKLLGCRWHVDHVIPLNGNEVCGLHVWNNLQVITKQANLKKGNKFLPEHVDCVSMLWYKPYIS